MTARPPCFTLAPTHAERTSIKAERAKDIAVTEPTQPTAPTALPAATAAPPPATAAPAVAATVEHKEHAAGTLTGEALINFGIDTAKEAVIVMIAALILRRPLANAIAGKIAEEFRKILDNVTSASSGALDRITTRFDTALHENEGRFHAVLTRIEDSIVRDWHGTMKRFREATVVDLWAESAPRTGVVDEAERLMESGELEKAEAALRAAEESDWGSLKLLVKLLLSHNVNRPDDALAALQSRQPLFRNNHEFPWELANVYMALNSQQKAIEAAYEYVRLTNTQNLDRETRAGALVSLGYTYYWFGDYVSAIVQTREALLTLGDPANAATNQGLLIAYRANLAYYCAEIRQNPAEAFEYAEAAVQSSPRDANYLDTRGFVRMQFAGMTTDAASHEIVDPVKRRQDLEAAKQDFTAAGEIDPNTPDYYDHLAQVNQLLQAQVTPGSKPGQKP